MIENPDKRYCYICGKEIIIGVFCNASHQEYNLFAHIMGEPMLCADCWGKIERKGNDNE